MSRTLTRLLLLTLVLLFGALRADEPEKKDAPAGEGRKLTVKPNEVDDLVIKSDKLTLNNFTLAEKGNDLYGVKNKKLVALELSWSVKNRGEASSSQCLMAVGVDDKGEVLWALSSLFSADPQRTESAQTSVYVPAGTLKKTAAIKIVVQGDF